MSEINTVIFESVPSTNTYAKENVASRPMPSLISANEQTAGRGRHGKTFYSPKDTGLYMTLVFPAPDEECELLTPAAAVAVCSVLESVGCVPEIKWVNDIFIDKKKVCGILTEKFSKSGKEYVAIGIGINVTTADFPESLDIAGNIHIDVKLGKTEFAEMISKLILEYVDEPDNELMLSEYKNRLFILNRNIKYEKNGKEYSAIAIDVNSFCNLVVRRSDDTIDILSSGEISIKL